LGADTIALEKKFSASLPPWKSVQQTSDIWLEELLPQHRDICRTVIDNYDAHGVI
jgi:hypothetical protein